MQIQNNILLAPYTTFKIGGPAKYFGIVKDQFDALEAYEFAKQNKLPVFVLGGGSNVLISDTGFNGLVIKIENKGIEVLTNGVKESEEPEMAESVLLKVASGEVWDEVVRFSVQNQWWGMENLSHIPGSTGAIAVQNVGAYGQEAKNLIQSLIVFNTQTHQILEFSQTDCQFAYRKSIFNTTQKGKFIIFYLTFKLSKIPKPILEYKDLKQKFGNSKPSLSEIREAVIDIRNHKYPFPTEPKLGNAGSFFKNLNLSEEGYLNLKTKIQKLYGTETLNIFEGKVYKENNIYKVPTAFLLEICELKDLEFGGAKINPNQPLVIVNNSGSATAKDVINLANMVIDKVFTHLDTRLQIEPELVGDF